MELESLESALKSAFFDTSIAQYIKLQWHSTPLDTQISNCPHCIDFGYKAMIPAC